MQRRLFIGLGLAVLGLANLSHAADKQDPTGTWKWKISINNQDTEMTLKLKLEGEKLSGTYQRGTGEETKIDDAVFKNNDVSFAVTGERNGQKFTVKYKGKVDGDSIKGKAEFTRNGEAQSRDWEPKRDKEKK